MPSFFELTQFNENHPALPIMLMIIVLFSIVNFIKSAAPSKGEDKKAISKAYVVNFIFAIAILVLSRLLELFHLL